MDLSILVQPSRWCAPVVIYALLALAGAILIATVAGALGPKISGMSKLGLVAFWLVSVVIMMYIMLYLCHEDLEWAAWLLLLLPIVVAAWHRSQ
jgi:hypothetical protein